MVKNEFPCSDEYPVWLQNLLSAYNVHFIQKRSWGEEYLMETFLTKYAPEVVLLNDDEIVWSIVDEDAYDAVVEHWGRDCGLS